MLETEMPTGNCFSLGKIEKLNFWESKISITLNINNSKTKRAKCNYRGIIKKPIEYSFKKRLCEGIVYSYRFWNIVVQRYVGFCLKISNLKPDNWSLSNNVKPWLKKKNVAFQQKDLLGPTSSYKNFAIYIIRFLSAHDTDFLTALRCTKMEASCLEGYIFTIFTS